MKKGFLHIAEVIIVAILVFVIISQFYNIPKPSNEWSRTKLTVITQDLIASMEEIGVDWFDPTEVNDTLYNALPRSMGYTVKLQSYVRPVTNVLCACSSTNYTFLRNNVIYNYTFNGIRREYNFQRTDPGSLDLSPGGAHAQSDVVLLWGIPPSIDVQDLKDYLAGGRGIVLFSDLTEDDLTTDNLWIRDQLNVKWSYSTRPSGTGEFQYFNPTETGFTVKSIFENDPTYFSPDSFRDFGSSTERVYPNDDVQKKALVVLDNTYTNGVYKDLPVPLSIIDWAVEGNGRSAWMSGADISMGGPPTNKARRQLLKTLISWTAAGRDYTLADTILAQNSKASIRKSYGTDTYEPVRIELTVGYFF